MTTRLMLSLKSAAANPMESWSLRTLSYRAPIDVLSGGGNPYFASRRLSTLHETSDVPAGPDTDNLELNAMP